MSKDTFSFLEDAIKVLSEGTLNISKLTDEEKAFIEKALKMVGDKNKPQFLTAQGIQSLDKDYVISTLKQLNTNDTLTDEGKKIVALICNKLSGKLEEEGVGEKGELKALRMTDEEAEKIEKDKEDKEGLITVTASESKKEDEEEEEEKEEVDEKKDEESEESEEEKEEEVDEADIRTTKDNIIKAIKNVTDAKKLKELLGIITIGEKKDEESEEEEVDEKKDEESEESKEEKEKEDVDETSFEEDAAAMLRKEAKEEEEEEEEVDEKKSDDSEEKEEKEEKEEELDEASPTKMTWRKIFNKIERDNELKKYSKKRSGGSGVGDYKKFTIPLKVLLPKLGMKDVKELQKVIKNTELFSSGDGVEITEFGIKGNNLVMDLFILGSSFGEGKEEEEQE
jgi:chemotaxis protein histidine kinase CheA